MALRGLLGRAADHAGMLHRLCSRLGSFKLRLSVLGDDIPV